MAVSFFGCHILHSSYGHPARHWELDDGWQPTQQILDSWHWHHRNFRGKANAMRAVWVLGGNKLGRIGHWAFAEFRAVHEIEDEFERSIDSFVEST